MPSQLALPPATKTLSAADGKLLINSVMLVCIARNLAYSPHCPSVITVNCHQESECKRRLLCSFVLRCLSSFQRGDAYGSY